MKTNTIILLASALLCSANLLAQTSFGEIALTPEKAGGVYYAYPVTESINTPAPKGYKPFYISHYGRHGSRYLMSDNDYAWIRNRMHDAMDKGVLTPLGVDVTARLDSVWEEARGRGGELTPRGAREHHGIASRMIAAYPEVFENGADVTAASTQVMRCAHSMFAFMEGLKEQRPELQITRESSYRNMWYLCHHSAESGKYNGNDGPWKQEHDRFLEEMTKPERLLESLFTDKAYVRRWICPKDFMWGLYWIAAGMQNMETKLSFMDLFTSEELFDLWQVINFNFYSKDSAFPPAKGTFVDNAQNLLGHMVDTADEYIASGRHGATLRFGHDGNIIPLAALMHIPGSLLYEEDPHEVYKGFANFKIAPMAANIQMIFFHNKAGDVLVKFMQNEREVEIPGIPAYSFPFYRWEDARQTLRQYATTPSIDYMPKN